MTNRANGPVSAQADDHQEPPVVIRDKRKLDPKTGQMRPDPAVKLDKEQHVSAPEPTNGTPSVDGQPSAATNEAPPVAQDAPAPESDLAAERLEDLQRLQAEYVNYRKRVERDKGVARNFAIGEVAEALMPVLDDIQLAREHGDLADGPFAAIAEKLESSLERFDVVRYGTVGEEFDPEIHEALMDTPADDVTVQTVALVMQPGYKVGERILRPARVGVKSPQ